MASSDHKVQMSYYFMVYHWYGCTWVNQKLIGVSPINPLLHYILLTSGTMRHIRHNAAYLHEKISGCQLWLWPAAQHSGWLSLLTESGNVHVPLLHIANKSWHCHYLGVAFFLIGCCAIVGACISCWFLLILVPPAYLLLIPLGS